MWAGSLGAFVAGGAITGAGAGLLFRACLTTVVQLSANRRAGTLATLFVTSYAGLTVPVIGLGAASQLTSTRNALAGFAVLAVAGLVAVGTVRLRPEPVA